MKVLPSCVITCSGMTFQSEGGCLLFATAIFYSIRVSLLVRVTLGWRSAHYHLFLAIPFSGWPKATKEHFCHGHQLCGDPRERGKHQICNVIYVKKFYNANLLVPNLPTSLPPHNSPANTWTLLHSLLWYPADVCRLDTPHWIINYTSVSQ